MIWEPFLLLSTWSPASVSPGRRDTEGCGTGGEVKADFSSDCSVLFLCVLPESAQPEKGCQDRKDIELALALLYK